MRRRRNVPTPGWWLVALALACAPEAPTSPDLVARLDGEDIVYRDFELHLVELLRDDAEGLDNVTLSRLFDRFLDERLLVRLAVDQVLVPEGAAPRSAIDRLMERDPPPEPSAAEIIRAYERRRDSLARPERVRLRQILVEERATAERAAERLAQGEAFEAVAQDLSTIPSAASGGLRGELARTDLPPAFVDPIFGLDEGEVSGVVEAEYGFHIFQVMERLPADRPTLDEARPEILRSLRQSAAEARVRQLAAEARSRYNLQIFARNLPFNYQPSS
ncbi:MAG: peptidylprolyl isomerase [Acidobacteriota bacterium]